MQTALNIYTILLLVASPQRVCNSCQKVGACMYDQALGPYCCQIHQIIYKEVPGQFNPTGRHAKALSLSIFTLSLIQTSSFFLLIHNAGLCFPFFPCSLISFLSMAATPNPSDSMQFMQMISLSCSKLNETSTKSPSLPFL